MPKKLLRTAGILLCLATLGSAGAASFTLHGVQYPERRTVSLNFTPTSIAPAADLDAEVYYRNGQAGIEITFDDIKPAILFGGDVTCYVVWAISRDGLVENLGELVTRRLSGRASFSTGKKNFALMITAESYYLVGQPSELVVFFNSPPADMESTSFAYQGLAPAPEHHMDAIAHIKWDSKVPLDLLQARKAFELATRHEAGRHAAQVFGEAGTALKSANEIAATAPRSRELLDAARRAVSLSNEALNISMRRMEEAAMEERMARRRAETEALEARAAQAEEAAAAARRLAEEVRAETAALRQEKVALEAAMGTLRHEKLMLAGQAQGLSRDKTELQREAGRLEEMATRLQAEKDELKGRLQGALSHVAETRDSARGLVINLPDILFDLNEATLKNETRLVLAKLAGILLMMPDQAATIEGHTDSTGSEDYNLDSSERRADVVLDFMTAQGLDRERLAAVGYGMQHPVADNGTSSGRKQNRRVEIIISEESTAMAQLDPDEAR